MPPPTWLPPLQTNHGSSVHVTIVQCRSPPTCNSSGFVINVNALVTYACEDPRVSSARLIGLSLRRSFHIPSDDVDISTPSSYSTSKEVITNLIDLMPVPFLIDRFYWTASRFDGFLSSNMLGDESDVAGCIVRYLVKMKEANGQNPNQLFVVELTINREMIIQKDDFQKWIIWYDTQSRMNPNFESDYAEEISTPWYYNEAFYNLMAGEESQGQGAEEEYCAICMEMFVLGSGVIRLPCRHIFHGNCISELLAMSDLCPLCCMNYSLSLFAGL